MENVHGRARRCRIELSVKTHEQMSIQRVSLATTRQRASEQRDLAWVDNTHDIVSLMQGDGGRDPVVPRRFHHNQGCPRRHVTRAVLLEECAETVLSLLEGNSLGSGRWV